VKIDEIIDLHEMGGLSRFEFINLLEKRWCVLDRQIKKCTSGDSTWNDFQLWKGERQEISDLLEKLV
jgi:hypothetical protein